MTIKLYLNNEEESEISFMYNMKSNPYKLGDVLHLSVKELMPSHFEGLDNQFQENLTQKHNNLAEKFK